MEVIHGPVLIDHLCGTITFRPFKPDRYHENTAVYSDVHGRWALPPGDVAQLQAQVAVLDLSRHGLLVEDVPGHLTQLLQTMPQWRAEPERMYKAL
jgi:hypothetical protein